MIKYFCDWCLKEITDRSNSIYVKVTTITNVEKVYEICPNCRAALKEFISELGK